MNVRLAAALCCLAAFSLSLTACSHANGATPPVNASQANLQSLMSQKIHHVFVLVQENHSFDQYFGLYPGNGQTVENLGTAIAQGDDCLPNPAGGGCQRPFLITANKANAAYYRPDAADISGGGNSRFSQQYAIDGGKMDRFLIENQVTNPLLAQPTPLPANPTTAQMATYNNSLNPIITYDCDTIPYLWYYAKNFALFDHYFQGNTGQSTPGNVQLFAGQFGQTEVAAGKQPLGLSTLNQGSLTSGPAYTDGLPLNDDSNPPMSQLAFITSYFPDNNQVISVASMPVLLNPSQDTAAVATGVLGLVPDDIKQQASSGRGSVNWAWYEEGTTNAAPAAAFSSHHNAPLYFDYMNNPKSGFASATTLKDNTYSGPGLLADLKSGALGASGVFWVKGGANATTFPFHPNDPTLSTVFPGTDDHPGSGSSDHQVAEAYLATMINAIASSQYWNDSVIIVTWDDSGGMYDHLPPGSYGSTCPQDSSGAFAGQPCGEGVRLPLLVISPFAKTGAVVNNASDVGSILKFIEEVFQLPTLASLPDELTGTTAGLAPLDANSATSDLSQALDITKLMGNPNPASLAQIPGPAVPPAMSCSSLGLTPITPPATPPPTFETAGYYSSTNPQAAKQVPQVNDDND